MVLSLRCGISGGSKDRIEIPAVGRVVRKGKETKRNETGNQASGMWIRVRKGREEKEMRGGGEVGNAQGRRERGKVACSDWPSCGLVKLCAMAERGTAAPCRFMTPDEVLAPRRPTLTGSGFRTTQCLLSVGRRQPPVAVLVATAEQNLAKGRGCCPRGGGDGLGEK